MNQDIKKLILYQFAYYISLYERKFMLRKRKYEECSSEIDNAYNGSHVSHAKLMFPDKYENQIFKAGKKEIHFNSHIDGETIARLKKLISEIVDDNKQHLYKYDDNGNIPKGQEKEPDFVITYIVHSPGGAVHDVLNFVDYINFLRSTFFNLKFTSIITGLVASAGTIMCIIADVRQMTRFAYAMIHELSSEISRTNYTRIQTHAEHTEKLHSDLIQIYQECRNIDPNDEEKLKELETLLIRESWMTANEYKKHGFIDAIVADKLRKKST